MGFRILSPMTASVSQILVTPGQFVSTGDELVILEAMKMETAVRAESSGIVKIIACAEGDLVEVGNIMLEISEETRQEEELESSATESGDNTLLEELQVRKELLLDEKRPQAVSKRRAKGQMTARENLMMLVDEGSFVEYGGLVVAAQRSRRSMEDLIANTPADGLVAGMATINTSVVDSSNHAAAVLIYDYTVLAGTQGTMNHHKMDRILDLAHRRNLPVVLFGEGGGGRPGDVDQQTIAGLHISTFGRYAGIKSAKIAVVSGYCFAGNAALVGSSDIIIATKNVSIGMGGPAMIEGGGLGKFHPKDVGPADVHLENGVIDILVNDEKEAAVMAKKCLSYFQGRTKSWDVGNQGELIHSIPTNRKRTYQIMDIIETVFVIDSVVETRRHFGRGMITCLARLQGIPVGVIANNPVFDAGAITSDNAIKAREFIRLCDRFDLPVISLVDTPGIMVGPESEKTGTVRHASRMFSDSAACGVPFFGVILRRAYGLGAMAMLGGSTHHCQLCVSWPTGEFGAMGLEGAVKLGFRKELEAEPDETKRNALYEKMVAEAYERGKALSMATMFEIDDVINPSMTREILVKALNGYREV